MLCPTVPEKYDSYPQAYEKAAKKLLEIGFGSSLVNKGVHCRTGSLENHPDIA